MMPTLQSSSNAQMHRQTGRESVMTHVLARSTTNQSSERDCHNATRSQFKIHVDQMGATGGRQGVAEKNQAVVIDIDTVGRKPDASC